MPQVEVATLELIISLTDEISEKLNGVQSLYDSITESLGGVGSKITEIADGIAESAVEIVDGFVTMVEESLASLDGWDEALSGWFQKTVQWFVGWKEEIIGEEGIMATWFAGVAGFFAGLSEIEVKWPKITNPFAGIDWCGFVPEWIKDVLGICGGTVPKEEEEEVEGSNELDAPVVEPPADDGGGTTAVVENELAGYLAENPDDATDYGYDDYADYLASGSPNGMKPAPCSTGGGTTDDGGSDVTAPCGTSSGCGTGCTGKGCVADTYASGGYVDKDGGTVHKGEWVIPTEGGPVMTGGRDITMNLTYHIDKIVGVDDFEKTMEAHDRKLLRELRTIM